ncbi:MAG: GAF domain-containing protein [Anaerolineae bacterium]|nr:GAF domain-containing protein [Anaerolineae bacterium]
MAEEHAAVTAHRPLTELGQHAVVQARNRLYNRLTLIILAVTIPLLALAVIFISYLAGSRIRQNAEDQLRSMNYALSTNTSIWLDMNAAALQELASLDDIISMDPERQEPLLVAMANAYSHIYLVSTTDWDGMNVARSDDQPLQHYGRQLWQIGARNGVPLTFEVLVDEATGQSSLVTSIPIERESGTIVGVVMFASHLAQVSQEVRAIPTGNTGIAYIVDAQNRVVAHTNPVIAEEMRDFDTYPPVFALRGGQRGIIRFTDDDGVVWQAYVDSLPNGWGVVVQQQESELLNALTIFQQISWVALAVVMVLVGSIASAVIRRALRPIETLTEAATAIAAGELDRTVTVERNDEIGVLAQSFNSMTAQLRGLISGLEQRVAERTRGLEAAAEVSRATTSLLDPAKLLEQVVDLVRARFDLYYVGLFLLDEAGEYAVLHAGTGKAGRQMVFAGHKLSVGGDSMIGQCISQGYARIAQDITAEETHFDNPLLPETRSEMALPLRSRGRAIGAMTVQSAQMEAFDDADVAVMQTMADQVAVAIDNARLFASSQAALAEMEASQRRYLGRAWEAYDRSRRLSGYELTPTGTVPIDHAFLPETHLAMTRQQLTVERVAGAQAEDDASLAAPILLRGQPIGALGFRGVKREWSASEIALIETISEQFALAAENLRLIEESQRRAARERLTREITEKMRRAADIETLLQTTVQEMTTALGTAGAFVQLSQETEPPGNGQSAPSAEHAAPSTPTPEAEGEPTGSPGE